VEESTKGAEFFAGGFYYTEVTERNGGHGGFFEQKIRRGRKRGGED
jgi:hypothetical protein